MKESRIVPYVVYHSQLVYKETVNYTIEGQRERKKEKVKVREGRIGKNEKEKEKEV